MYTYWSYRFSLYWYQLASVQMSRDLIMKAALSYCIDEPLPCLFCSMSSSVMHITCRCPQRSGKGKKTFSGLSSNTSLSFALSHHTLSPSLTVSLSLSLSLSCVLLAKGLPRRWTAGCFNIISVIRWGHRQVHRWLASKGWAHAKSLAPLQALCLNSLHLALDYLFIFPFFLLPHFARLQLRAYTHTHTNPFSLLFVSPDWIRRGTDGDRGDAGYPQCIAPLTGPL